MSCRVLEKNVKKKFIQLILEYLKSMNIIEVYATYNKTKKNIQVENFYNQIGFTEIANNDNTKNYVSFLKDLLINDIKYINVTYDK